ncbi:MAG: Rrf2 family transcriptional regulator [Phycisphaerae bacterium]|nr:Rrf2 family transcriptional regulator [Phycisphaerae bacterium]
MISITAEYALRAVVFLGRETSRAWTTQQVAEATHVPVSYLSKVLQALVRAEIIQSVRGIYGGYQLAGPAAHLTALAIINSVDPIRRIRRCPLGLEQHSVRLCPLHRRVDDAIALAEKAFAETTIGELLAEPDKHARCSFPGNGKRAHPDRPPGKAPTRKRRARANARPRAADAPQKRG